METGHKLKGTRQPNINKNFPVLFAGTALKDTKYVSTLFIFILSTIKTVIGMVLYIEIGHLTCMCPNSVQSLAPYMCSPKHHQE